jgi:biopolymer transport protein ExbB/TolQ
VGNLLNLYESGGWVMHIILTMLILSLAVMIERFYKIIFIYHANSAELMKQVQKLILENNIEEAIKICDTNHKAAIYQIFKAALINANRPFDEIQDYVEVVKLSIVPKLQERLPYLFTVANTSTLLGLLGTVLGLIRTFQAIGAVEGAQKQLLLSSGISEAMNATAFALIVAVPSMFAYGYLYNRITTMIDDLEHYTAQLLVLLRTGGEYFDRFSNDKVTKSTEQTPKKLAA